MCGYVLSRNLEKVFWNRLKGLCIGPVDFVCLGKMAGRSWAPGPGVL